MAVGLLAAALALPARAGPDGPVRVEALGPGSPAVPGQTAEARLVLHNDGASDALLRIDLQLPAGWQAEPVLPVWLPPGGAADVTLRMTPPPTAAPGPHRIAVAVWDPGLFVREQANLTVEVLPHPDVAATVEPAFHQAPPGSPLWALVRVVNRGNVALRLRAAVQSPAGWPVEVPPGDIAVAPGETGQAGLWLRVPDFQPPGPYRLALTLQAPDWPATWQAEARVEVPAVVGVRVEPPEAVTVRPRERVPLRGRLLNAGNVPLRLRPSLSAPDGWRVEGLPGWLDLQPGGQAGLDGAVAVPPGTPPGTYSMSLDWLDAKGNRQAGWSQPITVLRAPAASAWALNPSLPALPGRPVALLARVANEGNVPLRLEPQVEVPPGWVVLVPPPEVELTPLEQETVLMSVLPPAGARAGPQAVRVTWSDDRAGVSAPASFALAAPEEARLQVSLLASPGYTVAEPYRLRFSVRNAGNRPERVRLEVRENLGIPTRPTPATLRLEPGQSAEVTVQADVPASLARSAYHRVILMAVSDQAPQVQASAEASVELVARSAPLQAAYRWLPVTAAWEARAGPAARHLVWEVTGSAVPEREGGGSLSVRLSEEGSLAVYQAPHWSAAAGRQTFALSPLTLFDREADGVDVRGRLGGWEAVLQALEAADGRLAGLRLGYGRDTLHDTSVQVLAAPTSGWAVASASVRTAPRPGLYLEGEAGCALRPSAGCGPGALQAASTYAVGPWSLAARWEGREPGYGGAPGGSRSLEALLAADLTSSLHVSAAWRESATGTTDRWPLADAREATVQLAGRRDSTALAARYRRRLESDAASGTSRQTDELRLDLSRPAGGGLVGHQLVLTAVEGTAAVPLRTVGYGLSAYLPATRGSIAPYVRLTVPIADGLGPVSLAGGLRWQRRLSPSLSVALGGGWEPGPPARALASVELRYDLGGGPGFRLAAEGSRATGESWVWNITAAYAVPLQVPLGRRPDVGSLQGQVLDAAGRPVAGVLVRLGTLSAATDTDGRFDFPALSPGTYYLTLLTGGRGPERLSLPPTPWRLEVAPGQRLHQVFRLVEAARITGRVTAEPAQPPARGAAGGPVTVAAPPLAPGGLIVEAVGPAGSASATTDADGRFTLGHLLPGAYRIRVRAENVPPLYEVHPQELSLQLAPGQEAEVAFVVRPVVRRVEVQEGGELQPEPSGP